VVEVLVLGGTMMSPTIGQITMSADAGVREGDIIAGKYRIDRVLGAGAMGVVVAAHHLRLDERVAIKFLLPETLANAEAVVRFDREARAAVRIKSEHVARVFDVGTLENGAPYMVMEHLEGGDLAAWLQERGPIPIEQAVEFILQALEAIAEAHGVGIVHRDLKPANLFVVRRADGLYAIKVLDFGISKLSLSGATSSAVGGTKTFAADAAEAEGQQRAESLSMTKTAAAMGSPFYMSPEQMQSARDVDARTDIWAIGIILWELLTGKVPFGGTTMPELCMQICTAPLPSLRDRWPDAPAGMVRIIVRCLEKDRRQRYANVAELAVALGEFGPTRAKSSVDRIVRIVAASGLSGNGLDLPPSSDKTRGPDAGETIAPLGRTASSVKRGKARIGMVAVGVLTLVGGAAALREWNRDRSVAVSAESGGAQGLVHSASALHGGAGAEIAETVARSVIAVSSPDAAAETSIDASGPAAVVAEAPASRRPMAAAPLPASANRPAVPSPAKPSGTTSVRPQRSACDPPFTFDDKGRKHFKPECYR
jgi:eukaryotic-like serine/threonine-protein kinase